LNKEEYFMPADRGDIGTPEEWLKRAKSNLILAKQPKPDGAFWEDYCFDAQQAAEKALKALRIHYKISFRL
jgi:HEPN domain-containing protein